jgi:hypothetical protein
VPARLNLAQSSQEGCPSWRCEHLPARSFALFFCLVWIRVLVHLALAGASFASWPVALRAVPKRNRDVSSGYIRMSNGWTFFLVLRELISRGWEDTSETSAGYQLAKGRIYAALSLSTVGSGVQRIRCLIRVLPTYVQPGSSRSIPDIVSQHPIQAKLNKPTPLNVVMVIMTRFHNTYLFDCVGSYIGLACHNQPGRASEWKPDGHRRQNSTINIGNSISP